MSDLYGVERLPLPRAQEMADIDRRAREEHGIPERLLMESAGRAIAMVVQALYPEGTVAAAVGSGHNGADAYIALRALKSWGREVRAIQAGSQPPDRALAHRWDLPVEPVEGSAEAVFCTADVILDGLLGTGTAGAPHERATQMIEAMNGSRAARVAVDGPSGIDFSTGAVPGACFRADVTVTLGYPKVGLLFQPARSRCGRIIAAEIGFQPVADDEVSAFVLTPDWARAFRPRRAPDAHKGDAGYLLIAAGRSGMSGAAVLAARGALAMGAGIVRIASDSANRRICQTAVPEAIFVDIDDDGAMAEAGEWAHAVVVGPGFGRDKRAQLRLDRVFETTGALPTLIDADGLNMFAGRSDALAQLAKSRPVAITPHPGEMARLLGVNTEGIVRDPVAVAASAAQQLRAAVLLKGAPSVVALSHEPVLVSAATSSAAASGGSGDVLSGACGAMLAARMPRREALGVALFYCARAAMLGPPIGRSSLEVVSDLPAALETPGAETPILPFVVFDQPPPR
ncbi:MAG: NAD(P)H-hydrate dehydratase [Gemmatimonadetes bacterium]|uniref:Bifunctional NAD(P)H-hydrate repair enzyme n=1 Tax=Candidatus Kutchimonas denitrificans TaxID=3056748 RepID=A0AAE5CDV4_9BACT|nr:NAD(P)H-hydrate dehydratase [Gemmatimonadota bacterium]NIR76589.1 NAD(P)H-hydrate dehydratase [Candidatus Kutchimonas denitrificans]NIS01145.1 NAD(P)H-hydrate dehydratase [Gemmatimonadota bacterium]NIT66912.1 NAD(P)H-hydrate dehydratase [Gemmatimonadota bacterium]NIU54685.1 NAD(P)H-hydrate dehydratase [Gemmatimonadota bacterium]